jgi:hypothetical protein
MNARIIKNTAFYYVPWLYIHDYNLKCIFSFFVQMKLIAFFFAAIISLTSTSGHAQTIPLREESFFLPLRFNGKLPEKLLSGRSVLFYDYHLSKGDLASIQRSFAGTGIDAIIAIETEKLLGGYDVSRALFKIIQKREVSNLVFIHKGKLGYRCVITSFNGKPDFIDQNQHAWQWEGNSLNELLVQVNREALASFKKQNLLINEQPESELLLNIISGSRIEPFTSDLRVDKLAVRLSGDGLQDGLLKEICQQYPFKVEFVADSISDADLRAKGFWYSLNCVHAREWQAKSLLGYVSAEGATTFNQQEVYKFYFKKLEFDNIYVGKQWDASPTWTQSLQNFIINLRKELKLDP